MAIASDESCDESKANNTVSPIDINSPRAFSSAVDSADAADAEADEEELDDDAVDASLVDEADDDVADAPDVPVASSVIVEAVSQAASKNTPAKRENRGLNI